MAGNTVALFSQGDVFQDDNPMSLACIQRSSCSVREHDVEDLQKAALEKLYGPQIAAKKAVIVPQPNGDFKVVDLSKLSKDDKALLFKKYFPAGHFETSPMLKVRERLERAGLGSGGVYVRWSNLVVMGRVGVGDAGVQTLRSTIVAQGKKLLGPITGEGQKLREMRVLDGVSGVLRPARFTLLLGPPGSGKTMLMRALAGQLRSEKKTIRVSYDELTYNGLRLDQFVVERSAVYVSQNDIHQGELTVRETLDFSSRCQGMERRRQLLGELQALEREKGITPDPDVDAWMTAMSNSGKSAMMTEVVIRMLGLENCADTVVGSAMLRGISGGQKKRVTTGEMIVGPMRVLLADEISTGLDSATTFDICNSLKSICQVLKFSVMVALLQPAPETFDLFDDILVLSSGRVVYHGPREGVLPFFEGLGFQCPERKGVADFLQEVTSPGDQQNFWSLPSTPYTPLDDASISTAFYATPAGKQILEELATPLDPAKQPPGQLETKRFGRRGSFLLRANLSRSWILMRRSLPFYIMRVVQVIMMGFMVGTLFLQQSRDSLNDAQLFMGVAFFSVMFMMTGAFPDSVLLIQRLPVFYKQRDAHFYPAWCFALPTVLLRLPWLFIETWIWTLMVYFMVGFYTGPRLLVFWGVLMVTSMFTGTLFLALAAVARTQTVASALQAFSILVFVSTSGFTLTSTKIPGGWKGAYWANPMAYFIRALVINEMSSPNWAQPLPNGMTLGETALMERGFQSGYEWVWAALFGWGFGTFFINNVALMLALRYLSAPRATTIVSEEFLAERGGDPGVATAVQVSAPKGQPGAPKAETVDIEKGGKAAGGDGEVHGGSSSLSFKPLCLTFKDMKYSVPLPKESAPPPSSKGADGPHSGQLLLLKGITGSFRPGVLTALMGASGAGKTTLMDVLAGRKTGGTITGDILVNGFPKEDRAFARIIGYVEQTDVHIPEATVHEALMFSAQLRLPADTPDAAVVDFVQEVMSLVELRGIKDSPVGMPGESGLSVEQRKRLTLAVELVANPSIVFMDEPTSGLDARAASIVMRAVRNTVNTGRTVVCTIHQPSIEIFEAFDELLLLKRGGEVIFNGAINGDYSAQKLIDYFSAIPHVPAIKPRYNPANWMLEVSSPDAESATGVDFAQLYRDSQLARSNDALVDTLSAPPPGDTALRYEDLKVAGMPRQLRLLLMRNFQQYARKIPYNGTRLIITVAIGLCFGTLYLHQGGDTSTFNGIFNIAGALYASVLFMGIMDCMMVQEVVSVRRTVYYREHAAGLYSSIPYSLAEVLVEVPYLVGQSCIYSLFVYWMIGFQADAGKFFWFLLIMILTLCYWTFFGIQNVHVTPALQLSNAMSATAFGLFNLFCGFIKPQPSIPAGWIWMYYINPLSWTLYGLVVGQLGDLDDATVVDGFGETVTVPQFIEDYFGYERSMMGWIVLILFGYIFFFTGTASLALRKLNFQKR